MGLCMSKSSNIEPSVPVPTPKARPPQPPSIPDGTTSTAPPKPSTPMTRSERTRAQSQVEGTAFSKRRHDNGRDYYPPPSSHPGVMYSPRNIQIARNCVGADLRPVERVILIRSGIDPCRMQQLCGAHHREGIGRHQLGDREVDHVSLSLCRAYFPMTSGMHSGTILSDYEN
jgi:hypothetical protein